MGRPYGGVGALSSPEETYYALKELLSSPEAMKALGKETYNEIEEKLTYSAEILFGDKEYGSTEAELAGKKTGEILLLVAESYGGIKGLTTAAKAGAKGASKALDGAMDEALRPSRLHPLDGTVESLDNKPVKTVIIDSKKYPESARHIEDAQNSGHPDILTVDRQGASKNRRDSLRGVETQKGLDRDEYPPAMFKEGGEGASVRHIDPKDNRGAGSCIGAQCRDVSDGEKVYIEIK